MKPKSKLSILLLSVTILFSTQISVLAAETQKIEVYYNAVDLRVKGKSLKSNNILYKGSIYAPIQDIAEKLKLSLSYSKKNNTIYLGKTELPDDVSLLPLPLTAEPILKKNYYDIDGILDGYTILVKGKEIISTSTKNAITNITSKGTTYVSVFYIGKLLDLPYMDLDRNEYALGYSDYYGDEKPDEEEIAIINRLNGIQPEEPIKSTIQTGFYDEPAEGDMDGWRILRGHEFENESKISFKMTGKESYVVQIEDIRPYDPDQLIEWTDSSGEVRYSKLSDVYKLFSRGSSNKIIDEYLEKTFGDLYFEWTRVRNIDAVYLVDQYLQETGELPTIKSNITLTPDVKLKTLPSEEPTPVNEMIEKIKSLH
jgi:hypothetical protein